MSLWRMRRCLSHADGLPNLSQARANGLMNPTAEGIRCCEKGKDYTQIGKKDETTQESATEE